MRNYDAVVLSGRGLHAGWCKRCGKQVGGLRARAVRHDLEQHQRACKAKVRRGKRVP
jgi:hypothetical protein